MPTDVNLPSLYSDNDDGFIVIAHRGASAYYPENTMSAFKGALAMDAEMIEFDVMASKDGVPIVFHDAMLDAHTNGRGLVKNFTLSELKKLDAGVWFDAEFIGEEIPTLEEVLEFASGQIALNIEIKTEAVTDELKDGIEKKCLKLVKDYGMENYVLFSSFDYRAVEHLKKLNPRISVALLYNLWRSNQRLPSKLVDHYKADAFNCNFRQLRKKWLVDLNEHNIPHFIYTVNRKRKMKALFDSGVTGIFTNRPDVLNKVIKKNV